MFRAISLSKIYGKGEKRVFALKDISFSLPEKGLFAIVGKSGSGKSTLLNLLSRAEEKTEGDLFYGDEDLSKLKGRKLENYRRFVCSFIYQHFELLEDCSAFENVLLPLKIRGESEKESKKKGESLFRTFHLEDLKNKKASLLSGGEKQRVAFLRAIITEPKVIFADEPTGALDKQNERLLMEALKKISKNTLVLFVTHNEKLVEEYADDFLRLEDGKLLKSVDIPTPSLETIPLKKKRRNTWFVKLIFRNYKKNLVKNILSFSSGLIGYLSLLIGFGFYAGSESSLKKERGHTLSYLQASLSKQVLYETEGSPLSLIRSEKPTLQEAEAFFQDFPSVSFENDYSYFFPSYHSFTLNGFSFESVNFVPLKDITLQDRSASFLSKGELPSGNSLNYCLVNEEFEKLVQKDPIGKRLKASNTVTISRDGKVDNVSIDFSFLVLGVVKEFPFLNTPKVFFSFPSFERSLKEKELENLSMDIGEFLETEDRNSAYYSYAYQIFFGEEDAFELEKYSQDLEEAGSEFVIASSSFAVNSSFQNLYEAFSSSLLPFAFIEILGVAFILSSLTYHSFLERRKQAAILTSLGSSKREIERIYGSEPLLTSLLSVFLAVLLSYPASLLASKYLEKRVGISSLVHIPYFSYLGVPFFPIALLLLFSLLIAFVSGFLPLWVSRKRNLLEELRDE
ncbi:MAG TPA: hypothetical protein DD384_05195 [Firmicutes bacterium]|nr:hypothetical protein [Bacillota bacterium]